MSARRHSLSAAPARRTLLGSEDRGRLLGSIAFEAIFELDLASGEMLWDTDLESIFGYAPGEVVERHSWWRERVHPDDLLRVEENADAAMHDLSSSTWANEYRFRRKDGSWASVASRCAIERNEQGHPLRVIGAMMDVTRLKDAEIRLRLFAG